MGSLVNVHIDEKKLWQVVNDASGTRDALESAVSAMTSTANSLGSGYRTGYFYDKQKKKRVGGTQPRYAGSVRKFGSFIVGIVHPKNYAAMKDNHLHNTLLKSMRKG